MFSNRCAFERIIEKIEYVGRQQTKCISVDSPDHSYLASKNYIVTHNSTVNWLTAVEWATNQDLWPSLWKTKPRTFWYLYPDARTATREFEGKISKDFLPQGAYKDDPTYGWTAKYRQGHISEIRFNNGVTIEMRYYSQGAPNFQAGSLHAIFTDEEIPFEIFGELRLRLIAHDGYFRAVCTPTLGQEEWARAIEPEYIGTEKELFKESEIDVLKLQVSMYDCLKYADGTDSHITLEKIKDVEATLTEREILVRVFGRFLKESGLKHANFDEESNVTKWHPLPADEWNYFVGIDWGGGGTSHESGIVVVGVNRQFTIARVVWSWISKGEKTTAGDVLDTYRRLVLSRFRVTRCFYDFSCKDLGTLAERAGVPMEKAEKSHDIGVPLLNTLFKTQALKIMHDWNNSGDNYKLITELKTLLSDTKKRHADDTLADGLRYALSKISFSIDEIVKARPDIDEKTIAKIKRTTRGDITNQTLEDQHNIITEMEEWDEYFSEDSLFEY